eukprot:12723937-Alexandrium_andersonii.AAC.1
MCSRSSQGAYAESADETGQRARRRRFSGAGPGGRQPLGKTCDFSTLLILCLKACSRVVANVLRLTY